jgi:branched-subunit amino acid ABC-type transport system permease component
MVLPYALIFGLLRIVNLARGALYPLGSYIGVHVAMKVHGGGAPWWPLLLLPASLNRKACCAASRGYDLRQVLLTSASPSS